MPRKKKTPKLNPVKTLQAIAFHEAGHAVVGWHLGLKLDRVSIHPSGTTMGQVAYHCTAKTLRISPGNPERTRLHLERLAMFCLAGYETVYNLGWSKKYNFGWKEDLDIATRCVRPLAFTREDLQAHLGWLALRARCLVAQRPLWKTVELLARELLQKQTLSGRQAVRLIGQSVQRWEKKRARTRRKEKTQRSKK